MRINPLGKSRSVDLNHLAFGRFKYGFPFKAHLVIRCDVLKPCGQRNRFEFVRDAWIGANDVYSIGHALTPPTPLSLPAQ